MSCITDGTLRARLDGELDDGALKEVEAHLASCARCSKRAESVRVQADEVRSVLRTLAPVPGNTPTDTRSALAQFRAQQDSAGRGFWLTRLFARPRRPVWAALGVFALIVACFSLAPVRSWGQKILIMLRVQKIAVVPFDPQLLMGPHRAGGPDKMLSQYISDDIVVTLRPGAPEIAAGPAQASQLAGFTVRMPAGRSDLPQIKVQGELAFQMTLHRDHLQAILEEVGRGDLQLPASIDGSLIAVHIPKLVMAMYGRCPDPKTDPPAKISDLRDCVVLGQVPSPTVSVPAELNIQQLAEVGLEAGGMSSREAQTFSQTVDWTSTFVLPIPRDAGSFEMVSVDGVQGTLVRLRGYGERHPPGYVLLWVKNGIVYSLTGSGNAEQAVPLADSLE